MKCRKSAEQAWGIARVCGVAVMLTMGWAVSPSARAADHPDARGGPVLVRRVVTRRPYLAIIGTAAPHLKPAAATPV